MISFPFSSLEDCQKQKTKTKQNKNKSINSPMLLLSNGLLCFSLLDKYCCSQSLNYHNFGIS